jgi:hypothetical protein
MNTNLIDMFGLSGDQESDDKLEELLARLETDTENSCGLGSLTANPGSRLHPPQAHLLLPARIVAQRHQDCRAPTKECEDTRL